MSQRGERRTKRIAKYSRKKWSSEQRKIRRELGQNLTSRNAQLRRARKSP